MKIILGTSIWDRDKENNTLIFEDDKGTIYTLSNLGDFRSFTYYAHPHYEADKRLLALNFYVTELIEVNDNTTLLEKMKKILYKLVNFNN